MYAGDFAESVSVWRSGSTMALTSHYFRTPSESAIGFAGLIKAPNGLKFGEDGEQAVPGESMCGIFLSRSLLRDLVDRWALTPHYLRIASVNAHPFSGFAKAPNGLKFGEDGEQVVPRRSMCGISLSRSLLRDLVDRWLCSACQLTQNPNA